MDLMLRDKLAPVTGSTKGIGLAIATALATEGARVIVNGRSEASVTRGARDRSRNGPPTPPSRAFRRPCHRRGSRPAGDALP